MTIRELLDRRANLISQAREIQELADSDERVMTDEEEQRFDDLMNEANGLTTRIENEQRMLEAEARSGQLAAQVGIQEDPGDPQDPNNPGERQATQVQFESRGMAALNDLQGGWREEPLWRQLFPFANDQYRSAFNDYLRHGEVRRLTDIRALQVDADVQGGYLVTPMQFVDRLIKALDDAVYIRQWATVFSVPNAESLGVPSLDTDPADADWTSELATGSEDSDMAFGRRALNPHPLAKRIKISNKLLRKTPSAESLVRERLAYKFGITWEKAALTGTGSEQPLGVFTASSNGISTNRDVSDDNTTTAVTFDGLINAKYTLKGGYWPRARWLFHRDGVKRIAKLKDSNGQYLWRESVRVGEPDRILGLPTFMSEYVPNTFTASQYVGILGDFSYYWIADSMAMSVQRLVELYAETNQVGLIGRLESDGMPVLEEAFVRVQLAAS